MPNRTVCCKCRCFQQLLSISHSRLTFFSRLQVLQLQSLCPLPPLRHPLRPSQERPRARVSINAPGPLPSPISRQKISRPFSHPLSTHAWFPVQCSYFYQTDPTSESPVPHCRQAEGSYPGLFRLMRDFFIGQVRGWHLVSIRR